MIHKPTKHIYTWHEDEWYPVVYNLKRYTPKGNKVLCQPLHAKLSDDLVKEYNEKLMAFERVKKKLGQAIHKERFK